MLDLTKSVSLHSLAVDLKKMHVKKKCRPFPPERQHANNAEVEKLLHVIVICEIKYPDWLANVVMVKKTKKNSECERCMS